MQMKPRKRGRSNVPIVNQDSMPELEIMQDSNEDCANLIEQNILTRSDMDFELFGDCTHIGVDPLQLTNE